MSTPEQKGQELMAQAEKKLKSGGGLLSFFSSGTSKKEDAVELYVRAANAFKMAKQWANAGSAFMKAAQTNIELSNKHEAATQFVDAGNCYRKGDPNEAINCLEKAVEIYTDMGRFTIAAKHHITIAEIFETELVDIEKSIRNYEQAGDYYKGEESNSSANKCLLKVAQYAAQLENYSKAIEIYEQVATSAMENKLLRYSAKDHFFRAIICRMCVEMCDASTNVQKYEEMFPAFGDSRECKLVKQLIAAHEDSNSEAFSEAIRVYDSVSRLDQWYSTLLLRVKKSIDGESDLR